MNASGQSQSTDPRVARYLDELNRALSGLPDAVRGEVYGDIRQHIDDELAQRPDDPSAVPEVLDRLGDPLEIAREAGAYPQLPPPQPPHRGKAHEIFAVILLAIGGFLAGIGWLVGLVLLWTSDRFTKADKVIGTLLVPGGFLTSLLFLGFGVAGPTTVESCSQSTSGPIIQGIPAAPVVRGSKPHVAHAHVSHAPVTHATQAASHSVCTGGHSVWFSIGLIALFLIVILGPLYTTIRLSRRVATM